MSQCSNSVSSNSDGPIEPILTGPLTFSLDFTDSTIDYDAILEDELESAANDEFVDSDLLTGPQVPEHTLKTHSFRYAYLFAISGKFRENLFSWNVWLKY